MLFFRRRITTTPEEKSRGAEGTFYDGLGKFATIVFALAAPLSLIFMTGLLAAGLSEARTAIKMYPWSWPFSEAEHIVAPHSLNACIGATIHALELFILAPFPYLVLANMAFFVSHFRSKHIEKKEEAAHTLPRIKAITASVLVSVTAVNLVGKVLEGIALTWESAGIQMMIIVVLSGYFFVLEIMNNDNSRKKPEQTITPNEPLSQKPESQRVP